MVGAARPLELVVVTASSVAVEPAPLVLVAVAFEPPPVVDEESLTSVGGL